MKMACSQGRAVVDCGKGWVDVAEASEGRFGPSPADVFESWDEFRAFAAGCEASGSSRPAGGWDPPSPCPRQIVAVGANYAHHASEMGLSDRGDLMVFTKFPSSLVGSGAVVKLPSRSVDWEVELVVVVGRRMHKVAVEHAWEYVAGVTVGQDLTDRHLQFEAGAGQFSLSKSFPGASPVGPYLVTTDELEHRDDMVLGCAFQGTTVQSSRTREMTRSVPELLSELSDRIILLPGDLVFTGSPPGSGHARSPRQYLSSGLLESWVEGVGMLSVELVS